MRTWMACRGDITWEGSGSSSRSGLWDLHEAVESINAVSTNFDGKVAGALLEYLTGHNILFWKSTNRLSLSRVFPRPSGCDLVLISLA